MAFAAKAEALAGTRVLLESLTLTPDEAAAHGIALNRDGRRRPAFELLSYPNMSVAALARVWPELAEIPAETAERLQVDARYAVYMDRQEAGILAYKKDEAVAIPPAFDFSGIAGLSNEIRQKLERHRPGTLAQASRIDGITPAALMLVLAHIRKAATGGLSWVGVAGNRSRAFACGAGGRITPGDFLSPRPFPARRMDGAECSKSCSGVPRPGEGRPNLAAIVFHTSLCSAKGKPLIRLNFG